MDDIKYEINNIECAKCKYFFIGFIVGIIPYLIILLLVKLINIDINDSIKYIFVLFTITSSILNAFVLSKCAYNKLIYFFENKYNLKYKFIKKEISFN